jgi:hypothetical protein
MKNKNNFCPSCKEPLNRFGQKPQWSYLEDEGDDIWCKKQPVSYFDNLDGEQYEILQCNNCLKTWDALDDSQAIFE